jgi:hypothetical protein
MVRTDYTTPLNALSHWERAGVRISSKITLILTFFQREKELYSRSHAPAWECIVLKNIPSY